MKFMMLMSPAVYQAEKKRHRTSSPTSRIWSYGTVQRRNGQSAQIESLNGLHPQSKGARVTFPKGKPAVTDGPFIESKEVLGGYWLVEAPSKEEVVKWAQRCPANEGDTIEIRQIFGPEISRK
jgi:hypothetical protein